MPLKKTKSRVFVLKTAVLVLKTKILVLKSAVLVLKTKILEKKSSHKNRHWRQDPPPLACFPVPGDAHETGEYEIEVGMKSFALAASPCDANGCAVTAQQKN